MQWVVLLVVTVVVVVVGAYALGTYLRRRQDIVSDVFRPAVPAEKVSPAKSINDREVRVVVTWLLSQAFEQTGVKVADDKMAFQRIVEAADKAVRELKTQPVANISLPYLTADASGPKHVEARLTREMIVELAKY
jgi:Hsp70 protein